MLERNTILLLALKMYSQYLVVLSHLIAFTETRWHIKPIFPSNIRNFIDLLKINLIAVRKQTPLELEQIRNVDVFTHPLRRVQDAAQGQFLNGVHLILILLDWLAYFRLKRLLCPIVYPFS